MMTKLRITPLRIATSGGQGVGKTTLTNRLEEELKKERLKVIRMVIPGDKDKSDHPQGFSSPERRSAAIGFPINEGTTFMSQTHILVSHMMYDLETIRRAQETGVDIILYDRVPALDVLPYSVYSKTTTRFQKEFHIDFARRYLQFFPMNIIFTPEPLGKIVSDGVRSTDPQYQKEIQKNFEITWYRGGVGTDTKIVKVPKFSDDEQESIQKRVDFCMKYIVDEYDDEVKKAQREVDELWKHRQ